MSYNFTVNSEIIATPGTFDRWDPVGRRCSYPLPWQAPSIKKIIFNAPATIVFWSDGTKTVVKCAKEESFDPEKGVAMAVWKKLLPNQYGRPGKKLIEETEDEVFRKLMRKKDCCMCEHYRRKDNEILCCMCYISGRFDKFKPKGMK